VGSQLIDLLCEVSGIRLSRRTSLVEWGEGIWCNQRIGLSRPLTYMNLSGAGVQSLLSRQGVQPEDLVVLHDDMDLALGRLKFKQRGSDGGHRGIRSIQETLGKNRFLRLRIGIGRPPRGIEASEYVLAPFGKDEMVEIDRAMRLAVDALKTLIQQGLEPAMHRYHSESNQGIPN
jgi:PTH1 family peptidyl-tRNA hydrolase